MSGCRVPLCGRQALQYCIASASLLAPLLAQNSRPAHVRPSPSPTQHSALPGCAGRRGRVHGGRRHAAHHRRDARQQPAGWVGGWVRYWLEHQWPAPVPAGRFTAARRAHHVPLPCPPAVVHGRSADPGEASRERLPNYLTLIPGPLHAGAAQLQVPAWRAAGHAPGPPSTAAASFPGCCSCSCCAPMQHLKLCPTRLAPALLLITSLSGGPPGISHRLPARARLQSLPRCDASGGRQRLQRCCRIWGSHSRGAVLQRRRALRACQRGPAGDAASGGRPAGAGWAFQPRLGQPSKQGRRRGRQQQQHLPIAAAASSRQRSITTAAVARSAAPCQLACSLELAAAGAATAAAGAVTQPCS